VGCRVVCFRNSAARSCSLSLLLDTARVLCSPTISRILHGLLYVCQIRSKAHFTYSKFFALVGFQGGELPPRVKITFQGRSFELGDLALCTSSDLALCTSSVDMKLFVFFLGTRLSWKMPDKFESQLTFIVAPRSLWLAIHYSTLSMQCSNT